LQLSIVTSEFNKEVAKVSLPVRVIMNDLVDYLVFGVQSDVPGLNWTRSVYFSLVKSFCTRLNSGVGCGGTGCSFGIKMSSQFFISFSLGNWACDSAHVYTAVHKTCPQAFVQIFAKYLPIS